ncbi:MULTISPECIES: TetR/AcrR family transcriptional regulator C-terminal domain-containing protein [Bacillus]|uniref:HTH tetR-type domain-containing protein n=2 Tax=Bacillus TaxID=1386 RepID=A0A0M4G0G6_9BACI|nr:MULTISPECIES: TetR/AcrR family transcriptional regulator C-terminal domain-containing protein [Bacillus]ALC83538.1 hypothetical protein AM592_19880 [Bacillus gobiensis]MBP1082520.1 AcrR family transcriptional regulator [Bacillus capparidis]MED1097246.1 TetR/AcrR family transcriptional regulator C-terminal domain-containing protein [Bacillus capparidis]
MAKNKINKEIITEAALSILHEKGLANLTMRNLAANLKVKAPALYWYIKSKQEILQLLSEYISSQIEYPEESKDWEEEMTLLSLASRRAMLSVPDGAEIMMDTLPVSKKRLHLINKAFEIFHRANFPEDKIFLSAILINSYVTSFVLDEQKQKKMIDEMGKEEIVNQFKGAITAIPEDNIPHVYRYMLTPKTKLNDEESFLAGLRIILKGIKAEMDR